MIGNNSNPVQVKWTHSTKSMDPLGLVLENGLLKIGSSPMRFYLINSTKGQPPWVSVVAQSKVIGQTMMLETLFNSIDMLTQPYPQPPYILETARTGQEIGDMLGSTSDEFLNLKGSPLRI